MRNVLLRDNVYEMLKGMKKEEESFADVIEKLYTESKGKKAIDYLYSFMSAKPGKDELDSARFLEENIGRAT